MPAVELSRTVRSLLTCAVLLISPAARAESVVTVAMTAGDIPITNGIPDQDSEDIRFVGYSLYDSLVGWDLSRSDRPADIMPGLAMKWEVDPANHRRWIFTIRKGVTFHDGCPFGADDVIWNFQRYTDQTVPNISRSLPDAYAGLIRHVATAQLTPVGGNWGHYSNPRMDAIITQVLDEFDLQKQAVLVKQLHDFMNEEAVMIWVAHDLNARALSPKLSGFHQAQSWYQDLTTITVSP